MIISNTGLFRKLLGFYTLIISYIPKRGHLNVIISTKSLFIIISNSLLLMLLLLLLLLSLLLLLWQRRKWEEELKNEDFQVDQNYRRCQKRERRMKRFANQKVRRWHNHCPQTRNGSRPTNYLQGQILFPEARSWSSYHIRS